VKLFADMSRRAADEDGDFIEKAAKRVKAWKITSSEEPIKFRNARELHILLGFHQDAKGLRNGKLEFMYYMTGT
jgi:hypothetical protein